jgi:hypothetical protein
MCQFAWRILGRMKEVMTKEWPPYGGLQLKRLSSFNNCEVGEMTLRTNFLSSLKVQIQHAHGIGNNSSILSKLRKWVGHSILGEAKVQKYIIST